MRNFLALVGLLTVTFLGAGWYLGWYKFDRTATDATGHQQIHIDINPNRVREDVTKGAEKLEQVVGDIAHNHGKDAPAPATNNAAAPINPLAPAAATLPLPNFPYHQNVTTRETATPPVSNNWRPLQAWGQDARQKLEEAAHQTVEDGTRRLLEPKR